MPRQTSKTYPGRRPVLLLVLIVAAIYVLLPQFGSFRSSWQLLSQPKAGPTALAIALTLATFLAAAGTYCFLAFKRLRYWRTVLVQLAATFVNRLLPAGIGALGANYLYLRHERHDAAQAGSMVALNNLLGVIGHGLLVAATLLVFSVSGQALAPKGWHGPDSGLLLKIGIAAAVILILLGVFLGSRRLTKFLKDLKKQLLSYRQRPWALVKALATSMVLTLCNVLALVCCLHALGLQLPFATVLLVFSFGLGAGSAIPTPGGLGGFEAGLAAGFVAYGIDASPALAATLLYRLISYWLPLVIGGGAFIIVQRRAIFRYG